MKTENLYEGQVFKNYKEMCRVLEVEVKSSTNSKNAQYKTLKQFCEYEKQGHEIKINKVYYGKRKRVDNRGGDYSSLKTPLSETNPKLAKQWNSDKNGVLSNDITKRTKASYWWICDACNEEIHLPPVKRFHKSKSLLDENITCPCCWMSKGASNIYKLLMRNDIKFLNEYTFDDLFGLKGNKLRFDFAILNTDNSLYGLIEYDGGFHDNDEVLIVHDKLKNDYCEENNIPLLRIHHTSDDIISDLKVMSFLKIKSNKEISKIENLIEENLKLETQIKLLQENLYRNKNEIKNIISNT